MVSAVMAHLRYIGVCRHGGVVSRDQPRSPRPFGEDCEEAGYVLDYLPGVLIGKVALDARLPDLIRLLDQVVACCVRWFHRRLHGRLVAARAFLVSDLGIPPMTLDLTSFSYLASPSQGSPLVLL